MLEILYGCAWFAGLLTLAVVIPCHLIVRFLGGRMGWAQGTRSRVAKVFVWAGVVLFAVIFRMEFVLLGSVAEGMQKDSPDGRYNAECRVGTEVGFFGGHRDYIEFQIVERASGKQVGRVEEPQSGPTQHLSVRGNGRVLWTPDSKQVTFSFGEDYQREFGVP